MLIQGYYSAFNGVQVPAEVEVQWRTGDAPLNATNIAYVKVISLDGAGNSGEISLEGLTEGEYYLLVKHFNHLAVITEQKIEFQAGEVSKVNLSEADSPDFYGCYGILPLWQENNGKLSLRAGNADGNIYVNIADFIIWRVANGSSPGTPEWDPRANFDGNEFINIIDFGLWRWNNGFQAYIPP